MAGMVEIGRCRYNQSGNAGDSLLLQINLSALAHGQRELYMNEITVHQVDITHHRLVELSRLADQAKPFYDWVEKTAKRITGSHKELNGILMSANRDDIAAVIDACYSEAEEKRPLLFDGIGRVYPQRVLDNG
jgi:hypothetical protein